MRYLAPVLGVSIILACAGLYYLTQIKKTRYRREILLAGASVMLLWNIHYAANLLRNMQAFEYFSGKVTRAEYLAEFIPEYPVLNFINANLAESSRTYLVNTGNRFYYYQRAVYSPGHFSSGPLIAAIRRSSSAADIASALKQQNITHLLVATNLTRATLADNLSKEEGNRWDAFQNIYLTLAFEANGFSLWEIKN